MARARSFLKFVRFYRSLGHGRFDALRRAWGMARHA